MSALDPAALRGSCRVPDLPSTRAGRPEGVEAAEWQERTLNDGRQYQVFRRHFDAETLAAEVGGQVLFHGAFYVLVALDA